MNYYNAYSTLSSKLVLILSDVSISRDLMIVS